MTGGPLQDYIAALQREYATGIAREHAYRPALKQLLEAYGGGGVIAVNDAAQMELVGSPDFQIRRGADPIGYAEAKDIGKDLDHPDLQEQFQRYRNALGNLIITNYLELRWYVDGELKVSVQLAGIAAKKIVARPGGIEEAQSLFERFFAQKPLAIGRSDLLAKRLASSAKLIRDLMLSIIEQSGKSNLIEQYEGFRRILLPGLTKPEFADMFAQTVVYGLFAARENHKGGRETFTRQGAAFDVPETNPFLRDLFSQITGPGIDKRLEWAVAELITLLRAVDIGAIRAQFELHKPGHDPVVHFYETFLREYDPRVREMRGVYYTPQPVVGYIVRSVDAILRERFGCAQGLADASRIQGSARVPAGGSAGSDARPPEHKVQVLDPATGTGSFLLRVIQQVYAQFKGDEGSWPGYVREHLLPRLHGFELMVAPYTIAHMKLALELRAGSDYQLDAGQRLNVYLTNTLENPFEQPPESLFGSAVADEAKSALKVKADTPILVVLGNPPYSGHSANKGKWIEKLLKNGTDTDLDPALSYYYVDGKPLGERNPKWLQDDYVKFIRWAQWRIDRTGQGVLAFITNHGYLDNPTFRGMRESLMHSFDEIYVLDLHGNSKKKERVPEDVQLQLEIGPKDENVFDIQQGVAICLMLKLPPGGAGVPARASVKQARVGGQGRPPHQSKTPARVFHADLWGSREVKYGRLDEADASDWLALSLTSPSYLFIKQDQGLKQEYELGQRIGDIMPQSVLGFQSHRDGFAISEVKETLEKRLVEMRDRSITDTQFAETYHLSDNRDWKLHLARAAIQRDEEWLGKLTECMYRPFDARYCYFSTVAMDYPRSLLEEHVAFMTNLVINVPRQTRAESWQHALVSDCPTPAVFVELKDGSTAIPLYLYPTDPSDPVTDAPGGRRPNLAPEFTDEMGARIKLKFIGNGRGDLKATFGPEDVLNYIYAVFYAPSYRNRYADLLKRDFPRVPLTSNKKLFRGLCELGGQLVRLHLMDPGAVDTSKHPLPKYPVKPDGKTGVEAHDGNGLLNLHNGGGGDLVEKVRWSSGGAGVPARDSLWRPGTAAHQNTGRVHINKFQYFEGISEETFNFMVGGYKPCEKWLKDRKGRKLSYDDQQHYKLICAILSQTRELMGRIDALIEKHGGWPLK